MFIVHLAGSDSKNPFKMFDAAEDAKEFAREAAYGDVKLVSVYEWHGDFNSGTSAIKTGRIQAILDYAHRKATPTPKPDPSLRLTPEMQEEIKRIVEKLPKVARKLT